MPACLAEIDGELYVDVSSMLVKYTDRQVTTQESFEFTYRLSKFPKNLQRPNYIWENILLVPLPNTLLVAQMVSCHMPLWVQLAEKIIGDYLEQDDVMVGVHYGVKDLIEAIYNAKIVLNDPEIEFSAIAYQDILGMKLATIEVVDVGGFKMIPAYAIYCFVRSVIDFFRYRLFAWV